MTQKTIRFLCIVLVYLYLCRCISYVFHQLTKIHEKTIDDFGSACTGMPLMALDLTQATIVYAEGDAPLVKHMAQVLADDIDVTNISHRDNSFTKKR